MIKRNKLYVFILIAILIAGFSVRLYRFDNPIADWHSWRQADTSAVSRNFIKYGFDLLHPRMNNISNVQSGLDNPQGYFFAEFPIYNAVQAALFKFIGIFTLEEWGRLISIISSCLTSLFLYLIVSRHSNKTIGLFAAFFFAFIPFDIYYGRTILADTSMAMAILGGTYFFDLWLERQYVSGKRNAPRISFLRILDRPEIYYILAIIFTALAFLLKPYAVFFVLPMIVLAYNRFSWKLIFKWQLWLFTSITVAPLVFWRIWMLQYPQGIPASAWLLNGNGIRFRPAFFRWLGYERLTKLISGYFGIIIIGFGLLNIKKLKEWLFFSSFFVSSLVYVCVFATGNVQHDYYQILVMPSIAILFAIGSYFLSEVYLIIFTHRSSQRSWDNLKLRIMNNASRIKEKQNNTEQFFLPIGTLMMIVCVVCGFFFAWQQVKDYFNINNPAIVIAGQAVDRLTPKNAKVIANYGGDSSFLYQTNRQGWASLEKPIPDLIKMGAAYMVIVNPGPQDLQLRKTYKTIAQTKQYIIFRL